MTRVQYFLFFSKLTLDITSLLSIIKQVIPPEKCYTYLCPKLTFILQFVIIPFLFSLKFLPSAISVSMRIVSNDIMSTGLGDRFYSSYFVALLYPRRSLILSSGTNVITGTWVDISIIDPSVEKFGLIRNAFGEVFFFDNKPSILFIQISNFIGTRWYGNLYITIFTSNWF